MSDVNIWADKFIKREMLSAGDLAQRFNIANPRTHPEAQRDATESSLNTVGWIDDISLSTNGDGPPSLADNPAAVMFDGHERVEIALVRGGPDMLVPVRWYQLTPEETDFALLVKDQTSAMAQIIPEKMAALMERAKAMTVAPGLQGMLERLKEQVADGLLTNGNGAGKDTEPQIDKAAELQEIWQVQPGQLWACGEHRIVCGDCTDKAVVELVMGGERADMMFTDPPYNVDYGSNQAPIWGRNVKKIVNDNMSDVDWVEFQNRWMSSSFSILENAAIYICMSAKEWHTVRSSFLSNGGHWSSDIIWVKSSLIPGRKNYHSRYEALLYGWIEGKQHYWCGDTTQDDIWEIKRNSINEFHPTQKPVEVPLRAIRNSTQINNIVYDPFLGSGTTMVAANNSDRRCFGIEIEPAYVAVTLERMNTLGVTPVLVKEPTG